jgi:hypothetical protein
MDIDKRGYWKPHVSYSPALLVPKTSKAVAARKKKIMSPLTHLFFKYFLMGLPLILYSLIPQPPRDPRNLPQGMIHTVFQYFDADSLKCFFF